MNRIIQFRSWDVDNKVMSKPFRLGHVPELNSDQHIVMQFTGLLDRHGKEIYESDWLDDTWCVFWGSGKYILQDFSTGDIVDLYEQTAITKEITGNSFEHPKEHTKMASDI